VPGPVCYGRGGTAPTVTDADAVLGYLPAASFAGGRMHLDIDAARDAIRTAVAEPLGMDVVEAAWGIERIVNANMANATRKVLAGHGADPRDLSLIAYGGKAFPTPIGEGIAVETTFGTGMNAPSSNEKSDTDRFLAWPLVRPAREKYLSRAASQLSKTSAVALRSGSLVLATSSATVAIGQVSAKPVSWTVSAAASKNFLVATAGSGSAW